MTDEANRSEAPPATRGWGKQIIGGIIGLLVGAMLLQAAPLVGWQPRDPGIVLLLAATVGSLINTLDRFAEAGSRLTRRTEGPGVRLLNVVVALLGVGVIGLLVMALSYVLVRLLNL